MALSADAPASLVAKVLSLKDLVFLVHYLAFYLVGYSPDKWYGRRLRRLRRDRLEEGDEDDDDEEEDEEV